jgi:GNAT superfamily N-acetyltransferase
MSHYGDYISERLGKLIYECPEGFAVYWYRQGPLGEVVYIEDIYVTPKFRKTGAASKMADYIADEARAKGVNWLLGSVNPEANGATTSLKVLLAYGMTLDRVGGDGLIYFVKDLGE